MFSYSYSWIAPKIKKEAVVFPTYPISKGHLFVTWERRGGVWGGVTEVFFLHGFIDLHALNHWDQMPNSCMKFTVNRYTICYTPFFPSWSQLQQNNIFFFAIKYSRKICEAEKQLCDRSDDCRPHFSTEKSWFKHTSSGLTIDKHPSWLMMPSTVSGHMQTV